MSKTTTTVGKDLPPPEEDKKLFSDEQMFILNKLCRAYIDEHEQKVTVKGYLLGTIYFVFQIVITLALLVYISHG
jgi:hypothetical protein